MRALLFTIIGVVAGGCGAQPSEETSKAELGLSLTRVTDTEVVGTFATSAGTVAFSSSMAGADVVDVKLDRGERAFSSHVNLARLENDLSISGGAEVTAEDRTIFQALTSALEEELGKTTDVSDNLLRQANLWGAHPEGKLVIEHVKASEERSWTTLCNGTAYRNFSHDSSKHGNITEYLKYGPAETANPCRGRCGPGCNGVGTSAWTVDCGEHDRCEQHNSSLGCSDEFASASDDFSFAKNCSY